MQIDVFQVGPFQENTYLLRKDGNAILVDPGFSNRVEFERFRNALGEQTQLLAVLITHAHIDHVLGIPYIRSNWPDAPVLMGHRDLSLWRNMGVQSVAFGFPQLALGEDPGELLIDQVRSIGPFTFKTLFTPGHSPDHCSFYFDGEEAVFSGDVLFKGSIGRTDILKGDLPTLEASIRTGLYSLPDRVAVYSGHGPATTIGAEKRDNPFVRAV